MYVFVRACACACACACAYAYVCVGGEGMLGLCEDGHLLLMTWGALSYRTDTGGEWSRAPTMCHVPCAMCHVPCVKGGEGVHMTCEIASSFSSDLQAPT